MSLQKLVAVTSAVKEVEKSKITGILDLSIVSLYNMYLYYLEFTDDKEIFEDENVALWNKIEELKSKYPKQICQYKAKAPDSILSVDSGSISSASGQTAPEVGDFTITDWVQEQLFSSGSYYTTHTFTQAEFANVYSDVDGDTAFAALLLYRDTMEEGNLKRTDTATTGQVFGEDSLPITIAYADIPKWAFYSDSVTELEHTLNFQLIDNQGGILVPSNTGIVTLDRAAEDGNQPATIGDAAYYPGNRVTTVITTAMVTSGLTPPYNDPEGDLIDAIRIDEISTANVGAYQYNAIDVVKDQIISKADLDANLFTHVGADINVIGTDAINISARDAGSLTWVQ